MASSASVKIGELAASQCAALAKIVNAAFLKDAFFKKPEFAHRVDDHGQRLMDLAAAENSAVLVATLGESVAGIVHVHWHNETEEPHGGFGMLSVDASFQNAGIGKALVAAAEARIKGELASCAAPFVEIPVINVRPDLIPWYERQGYQRFAERPFEAPHILLPGYDVSFVVMRKML